MGKRAQRRRAEKEAAQAARRGQRVRSQFDGCCRVCGQEMTDWRSHSNDKMSNDVLCPFAGLHCEDCCRADWSDLDE